MYLLGYSLNNLSLMALTIATGFVVDDAIVVLENITRYREAGHGRLAGGAARRAGDRLHRAVDEHLAGGGVHPDPADGGIVGRLFREFAVMLSAAIVRLAAGVAHHHADDVRHGPARAGERRARLLLPGERAGLSAGCCAATRRASAWALRHPPGVLLVTLLTIALNIYLFVDRAQGVLPPAGHRAPHRRHPGRAGHLVSVHAAEADARWSGSSPTIRPSTT